MNPRQQNDLKVERKLVIIGCGSQGRMLKNFVAHYSLGYRFIGFLDDQITTFKEVEGAFMAPLSYSYELLKDDVHFILAIGNVDDRFEVAKRVMHIPENRYATIIHPDAYVDRTVKIGAGTYISANAAIMHDVSIGHHTSILTGSVIEYESRIGSFVNISPNATLCGNVCVDDISFVGAGASIIQGITLGKRNLIGAGATVIRDVADNSLALGTPAMSKPRKTETTLFNVFF
ncbi:acetyltransferase [Listeria fleischmannii]|nr:acetyltransferase [Listeria fleischmannii]EMG29434.1 sugar O-acyltransferase, sialic acid O-acetyltransferase NeuD family protein [Listeria fleischmannii subsp. fleischmannii LU2006-1]